MLFNLKNEKIYLLKYKLFILENNIKIKDKKLNEKLKNIKNIDNLNYDYIVKLNTNLNYYFISNDIKNYYKFIEIYN